jgi:hypothetical protein
MEKTVSLDSFDDSKVKCDHCKKYFLKEDTTLCGKSVHSSKLVNVCRSCTIHYWEIMAKKC